MQKAKEADSRQSPGGEPGEHDEKRTTVSLSRVVWQMAQFLMEEEGFNGNFSSFVADRIRRHHESWFSSRVLISSAGAKRQSRRAKPLPHPFPRRK